jgi:drug/metabolite transporter (DMT)-like permease
MRNKGIFLSLGVAGISGISIFANALFVSKTDPLIFTLIRNVVVALILTMLLVAGGQIKKLVTLLKREWGKLAAIGAIGGGIPFALFFTGLSYIGAVNGNILQKTLFLWVALLAVPLLHEKLSKLQLVGYFTLFVGMFVFGGTLHVIWNTGTWFVLVATILWAIENVIAKVTLKTVPSTIVSWGRMVFGLPFLIAAVVLFGKIGSISFSLTPILVSSVLLAVYVTTWYKALSMAPATLVSSILVFAPVVTAIVSLVIFHKPILGQQVTMIALLTAGTLLLIVERLFQYDL